MKTGTNYGANKEDITELAKPYSCLLGIPLKNTPSPNGLDYVPEKLGGVGVLKSPFVTKDLAFGIAELYERRTHIFKVSSDKRDATKREISLKYHLGKNKIIVYTCNMSCQNGESECDCLSRENAETGQSSKA